MARTVPWIAAIWLLFGLSGAGAPLPPVGTDSVKTDPLGVVLMPLANSTNDPTATTMVRPILAAGLSGKGFHLADDDRLEELLFEHRIRHTDSLSIEHSRLLADGLGAHFIVVGRVLHLRREPVPEIGLAVRMIDADTGRIVWAGVHDASGTDYRIVLGLREIHELEPLIGRAVRETLSTLVLDPDGALSRPRASRVRDQGFAPDAVIYIDKRAPWDEVRSVGLLPLENRSRINRAETIVQETLISRLWQLGRFEVVEPGELRHQLGERRLYPVLVAGPEILGRFQQELGIDAFLTGTVLRYDSAPEGVTGLEPVVEIALRLVATESGKIIWSAIHARHGNDGTTLYEAGRHDHATELVRSTIDDMLASLPRRRRAAR